MFDNIAAIDIGTHSIKVATVRTGLRDFQLKSFLFENINLDIENETEAIIEALGRILKQDSLMGYKIITNLPMEKAIIRNISFPFNDVEKIAEAIPFEAEENMPFNMSEIIIDFLPLKSNQEEEGRVLLAAAHKKHLYEFIETLSEVDIQPLKMGMESNALFECYKYFNQIEEETVIQLDIGNNKTIINIIENNKLLYTRSISEGISEIHKEVSDALKVEYADAVGIFEQLELDLVSFENNIHKDKYKEIGINRAQLKRIHTTASEIIEDIVSQIFLTTKAFFLDYGKITFSRALISGGGANIQGLSTMLSKELEIPVTELPFVEGYTDPRVQTQFPIAFGTILAYLGTKRSSVNFLKGEFLPDIASATRKIYYLSASFLIMTVIVLVFKLISSFILTARSNSYYNEILRKNFISYFGQKNLADDPILDAKKILKKKRKEYESISSLVTEDESILQLLKEILNHWSMDETFDLKNLTINERVIRIDGSISSSKAIDEFKEKLIQSKKFDTVTLNIKYSRKDEVPFTMTIKQKVEKKLPDSD